MIAVPMGAPGSLLIGPFLRMAQGLNAVNEVNTEPGTRVHRDGWGAVVERDGQLHVLRSTSPCWEDPGIETLRDVRIFLMHARNASRGSVTIGNTHPFEYAVDGTRWFYCHNGTIRDPLPASPTLGVDAGTDSERIFHLLLPYVASQRVRNGINAVYGQVGDFTSLNSFLFGPDAMWAVAVHATDPGYFTLSLAETANGPIVASEPLHELSADWRGIPNQHMIHIDRTTGDLQTFPMGR
jgi:predicted glutamine amidotransferase